jgi:hypothetical protein
MATPAQMYDHKLNPLKGWPSPYALDKAAPVADGEEGIIWGKVGHLDPVDAKFRVGLNGNNMPIFFWRSESHFDAMGGDDGNISLYGNMKGVSGLVATGSYELQTTEFEAGQTYNPNTPLTAVEAAGDDKGKITPGAFYTDTVCGVVSDGQSVNAHKRAVVSFWSYFLPATP